MANKIPKRHHYVPRVYLKSWTNESGLIAFRRRDNSTHVLTSTLNVAVEKGFHGVGQEAIEREKFFGKLETQWPRLRQSLVDGKPLDSEARNTIARFLAYQRARNREERSRAEFHKSVTRFLGNRTLDNSSIREFLVEHWGTSNPTPGEIAGARTYAEIFRHKDFSDDFSLDVVKMTDTMDIMSDLLKAFTWRVERMPKAELLTSDAPVVYWRKRSPKDKFEGIGPTGAEEIWFPLDPLHLLVLAKTPGKLGLWKMSTKRLTFVNREIASRCYEAIIGSPSSSGLIDSFTLSPKKPALRFNIAPGYERDSSGNDVLMSGEILHTWVPAYDDILDIPTGRQEN